MTPENLLGEWARLLVETLAAAGIRDVVISPGSRSTPFTWAALQHARLRCRVLIDERSAGFYALGQTKLSGVPSALICTSGSALANYFPAVVEAAESGTPLVIVSADRPYELQASAAAQTIDQVKIFGGYVRSFTDLGMPDGDSAALSGLMRAVTQAVHAAQAPLPGPVHLNARARKPLEPRSAVSEAGRQLEQRVSALIRRGPTRVRAARALPCSSAIEELAERCASSERGLITCGPVPLPAALGGFDPKSLLDLASATGFPLLAEATSQARFSAPAGAPLCDAFDWLCGSESFASHAAPDLIVHFGRPLTSGHFERYAQRYRDVPRFVVAPFAWPDPDGTATQIIRGDPALVLRDVCNALQTRPKTRAVREFGMLWREANALAQQAIRDALAGEAEASEGRAVHAIVNALPNGVLLAVGNSLPIRELDWFGMRRGLNVAVLAQRGANGIDGVISAAAGAASVSQKPVVLLVGDVSFLHDVGGLYAARELSTPLYVVVLNNRGGRIFEQLPIARSRSANTPDLAAWLTPHACKLEHAAKLYELPYTRLVDLDRLTPDMFDPAQRGAQVIEVDLDPAAATAPLASIAAAIETRLSRWLAARAAEASA